MRAQISGQAIIMIFALVVAAGILGFGYSMISKLPLDEAAIARFAKDLSEDASTTRSYGSEKLNKQFGIPTKYTAVCIVDLELFRVSPEKTSIIDKPLIKDSVITKRQKNVFLYPKGDVSIMIEGISAKDGYKCFSATKGKVTIQKMVGCGDYTTTSDNKQDDTGACNNE